MKKTFPNRPQRALLVTALGLSGLFLSACGGGGSTPGTGPAKLSGAVMDGYIKGATVCLDTNANLKCDDDIKTISADNGSYSLTIPEGVDASKYHVVADVGTDAVDSDSPNTPIAKAYTLMAPASDAGVVTPLTTFVSHNMITTPSLSVDEAKAQTITSLNLPANTNLSKDYVADKDTKTHQVAQMAATVLGQVKADVVTAVNPTNKDEEIQALKRALKESQKVIAQYALSAAAAANVTDVAAVKDAAKTAAGSSVASSSAAIKTEVQQQAVIGDSKLAKFVDFFKSDSMFDVWSNNMYTTTSSSSSVVTKLVLNQVSSTDGSKVTFKNLNAQKGATTWSDGYGSASANTDWEYSSSQSKWVVQNVNGSGGGVIAANADGLGGIFTDDATKNSTKLSFTILDVSGKKASQVPLLLQDVDGNCGPDKCADFTDFTLPAGSLILGGTFYRTQDEYRAWDCTDCGPGYYDLAQKKQVNFSTLASLIDWAKGFNAATSGTTPQFVWIGNSYAKLTATDANSGTITFVMPNSTAGGVNYSQLGKGSYTISTLGGSKVMVVRVTSENTPGTLIGTGSNHSSYVSTPYETNILVELNGKVVNGKMRFKGMTDQNGRPSLNRVAMEAFLKAQGGYPALPQ